MRLHLGPLEVVADVADGSARRALDGLAAASPAGDVTSAYSPTTRCAVSIDLDLRPRATFPAEALVLDGEPGAPAWRADCARPAWSCSGDGLSHVRLTVTARDTALAVQSFLKFLLSEVLLRTGGLALHAAAVRRASGAYVLLARSGGGKTTFARLFGGSHVLADDYCALAPVQGGGWHVFPVPFTGREGLASSGPAVPLRRVAELGQAAVPAWTAYERSATVSALVRHALVYTRTRAARTALLDSAGRVACAVEGGRLDFNLVEPPWRHLDGDL